MIAYNDSHGATIAFYKALRKAPTNARILKNLNDMLRRENPTCTEVTKFDIYDMECEVR